MKRIYTDARTWHPHAHEHARVVVMEEVDAEDVRVYLAGQDDDRWVRDAEAQHFAEVMANEEGWEYVN